MSIVDLDLSDIELNVETSLHQPFDYDKVYYLSGPMSGYPEYNFPAFEEAAHILRKHEILVESPHEIDHGETDENRGQLPYETYMKSALDLQRNKCHGIILLPGWPQSTGARREVELAFELDMPVYYYHTLPQYRDEVLLISMNQRPPA